MWTSLIFILTGNLLSYARFYVAQNKDLFSGLAKAKRRTRSFTSSLKEIPSVVQDLPDPEE